MISEPNVIHLDLRLYGAIFLGTVLALVLLLRKVLPILSSEKGTRPTNAGWYVPVVDSHGAGSSVFHTWDVRFKCAALFLYCFCIAFLSTPKAAGIALFCSVMALFAGRLSLVRAVKRLSAMAAFLSMFIIVMPLAAVQHPGDTLFVMEPLPLVFNLRGFYLSITIVMKAAAIALLMEPLFNTAPLSVLVNGLQRLGIPSQVCQMVLMTHRYIFVILHEAKRMNMAMRVRGFRKRSDLQTLRIMGNFVGMLLVRSIDRTERVYQAMLARGYRDSFPVYHEYQSVSLDWYKAIACIGLGVCLLFFDRVGLF